MFYLRRRNPLNQDEILEAFNRGFRAAIKIRLGMPGLNIRQAWDPNFAGQRLFEILADPVIVEALWRTMQAQPKKKQTTGYAYTIAKNLAVDAFRSFGATARKRARRMLRKIRKHRLMRAEHLWLQQFESAKEEFEHLPIHHLTETKQNWMATVRMMLFEGLPQTKVMQRFKITDNLVQQWKFRGVNHLKSLPMISDNLKRVLDISTRLTKLGSEEWPKLPSWMYEEYFFVHHH